MIGVSTWGMVEASATKVVMVMVVKYYRGQNPIVTGCE